MKTKEERIIKKYENRKLYDTESHSYIKLDEFFSIVKDRSKNVKVIDQKSHKDITHKVLIQSFVQKLQDKTKKEDCEKLISFIESF